MFVECFFRNYQREYLKWMVFLISLVDVSCLRNIHAVYYSAIYSLFAQIHNFIKIWILIWMKNHLLKPFSLLMLWREFSFLSNCFYTISSYKNCFSYAQFKSLIQICIFFDEYSNKWDFLFESLHLRNQKKHIQQSIRQAIIEIRFSPWTFSSLRIREYIPWSNPTT